MCNEAQITPVMRNDNNTPYAAVLPK